MSEKKTILMIEDDHAIANFVYQAVIISDFRILTAHSGKEGLDMLYQNHPDLLLLDLGLPDMDGIDLLEKLGDKTQDVPVIVISARDREAEKVRALEMGADDYLVKPFGMSELVARIRTTLRRVDRLKGGQGASRDVYRVGDLTVDIARHQIILNGENIHFTQNEFKIMELLATHAGRVLTYDFILEHVWGPYGGNTSNQILRVNMANIRRKLKENPSDPRYIYTELGIGYRMLED